MQGAFVRALGTVYHLQCFKCMVRHFLSSSIPPMATCQVLTAVPLQDCGTVVASKFFPIDGPDGKQQPLCERDYFRRLNLICAKCGMALRGSYITACSPFTLPPSYLLPDRLHAHRQEVPRRTLHLLHLPDALRPSRLVLRARRRRLLPLSLFDPLRDEVRRMQYGDFETVRRDQSQHAGRVLAPRMLHDQQGTSTSPLELSMSYLTPEL